MLHRIYGNTYVVSFLSLESGVGVVAEARHTHGGIPFLNMQTCEFKVAVERTTTYRRVL